MRLLRIAGLALLLVFSMFRPSPTGAGAGQSVVIDVRTEWEWNSGHLDGAIFIPYDRLNAEIGKSVPDKNIRVELYCRSGRRSGIGLETLRSMGYKDVTNLGSVDDAAKALNKPIVR